MTDIHSEIEINDVSAENLSISQPSVLEDSFYFTFITEDLESEVVRVELNTDMRCIGGTLEDGFDWNDPHLKAQIRSHCLYFVNISNFRFKDSFDLSYLFVENPIRYETVNDTVYAVTDEYKDIQVAVPIYTPYEVERENCWFNETLNESFCETYNITKYNVTGKLISPDEFSDYSPDLFIINIIPEDSWDTVEVGIGLGNQGMVHNLTENQYDIGDSISDSVIYLDPYLYSASVGTPMEPVITTGEHFETNFESSSLDDGLVLAMTFDNGSAFDDSGNGNDGVVGGATIGTGKYGSGYDFDGDGDGDNIELPFTFSETHTISMWIKAHSLTRGGLFSNYEPISGISTELNGAGGGIRYQIVRTVTDTDFSVSGVINQNQWHHIIFTTDSSLISKIYIDSDLKVTNSDGVGAYVPPSATPLRLGTLGGIALDFNGSIDEVMIYNRSLNSSEISDIYNNQKTIFENDNFEVQSGRWYITERSDTQDEWGNDNKAITFAGDGSTTSYLDYSETYGKNITLKTKIKMSSYNARIGLTGTATTRYIQIADVGNTVGYKYANGTFSSVSHNIDTDTWYDVKIIRRNTEVSAFINDELVGSWVDSSLSSYDSDIRFYFYNGIMGYLDDIQIYEHAPEYDSSLVYAMGDEGRNLVEDYNPLNISRNGAVWNATNDAYEFDGSWDYINLDSDLEFQTVSFWAKPVEYDITYFTNEAGRTIQTDSGGNLIMYDGSAKSFNYKPIIDSWSYFTIANVGNNWSLYVDGNYESSINSSYVFQIKYIGRNHASVAFNGSISDVLIFNRSLSADEISDIYNRGRSKYYPTTATNTTGDLKLSLRDFVDVNNTPCSTYTVDWQNESGSSIYSEDYSCSDLSLDDAEITLSSDSTEKLQSYQANVLVNPYIYNYYENETTTPAGSSFASGTVNGSLIIDGDLDTWGVTPTTGFSVINFTVQSQNEGNILQYKWDGGSAVSGDDSYIDMYCYNYTRSGWDRILTAQCMSPGYLANGCGNQSRNLTIPAVCLDGDILKIAMWHNIITELKEYDIRVLWNLTNQSDSYSALSESIYIENLPPTVTNPALNNTTPYTNSVISCNGGTFSDSDGDSELDREYRWYENDALISGNDSQTLSLAESGLDKHDNITCSIRVSDGTDWSSWMNSSNTATIQNTIPGTPSLISPADSLRQTGNSVILNWSNSSDTDSDSLTYYLKVDSSIIYSGSDTNYTLSTTDGSSYSWTVLVSDGEANSSWATVYTFTENSLPTTTAEISPSSPLVANDLTCNNATLSDNESDSVTISSYDWHNGTAYLGINSKTLASGNTSKGSVMEMQNHIKR